jgi:hypothetical protein
MSNMDDSVLCLVGLGSSTEMSNDGCSLVPFDAFLDSTWVPYLLPPLVSVGVASSALVTSPSLSCCKSFIKAISF